MSDPNKLPIKWFGEQQLAKLQESKNLDKPSWLTMSYGDLLGRVRDEIEELQAAIIDRVIGSFNQEDIIKECADVANFVNMIAHKAKEGH